MGTHWKRLCGCGFVQIMTHPFLTNSKKWLDLRLAIQVCLTQSERVWRKTLETWAWTFFATHVSTVWQTAVWAWVVGIRLDKYKRKYLRYDKTRGRSKSKVQDKRMAFGVWARKAKYKTKHLLVSNQACLASKRCRLSKHTLWEQVRVWGVYTYGLKCVFLNFIQNKFVSSYTECILYVEKYYLYSLPMRISLRPVATNHIGVHYSGLSGPRTEFNSRHDRNILCLV
jgi:hypothetical protein